MYCVYCKYWILSEVTSTTKSGKKNYATRNCIRTAKDIESSTNACKRFRLAKYFFCDKLNCQKDFVACLYSSEYAKFGKYPQLRSDCLKCRQFEKHIKPICIQYNIENPKPVLKLRRRQKQEQKLKRRKPKESPKLRRRKHPPPITIPKQIQKLRRRKTKSIVKLRRRKR